MNIIDGITQEVDQLSRQPNLPYLDAVGMRKLAVMLVQTVESDSTISIDARGALIGTAAVLVKHSRDLVAVAVDAELLVMRMMNAAREPNSGEADMTQH